MTRAIDFYIGQIAPDSALKAVFHCGQQVSPATRDETKLKCLLAEKRRIAEKPALRRRKCLTCGTSFISEGPHQRLCNKHRGEVNALVPDQGMPSYKARIGR